LQKNGIANAVLVGTLHLFAQPLDLLFQFPAVLIGLVHYLIPVNILVLYTAMQRIDLRLVQAAKGLGANPFRAFLGVFLPLSLPGVLASSMLIFVVSLGFFVTPALLGGPNEMTVAMQIDSYFTDTVDWGLGSALATILLAVTLIVIAGYLAILRRPTLR
jgi:ABC-type spermidine/putrescine transport system permease subunit I